MAHSHPPDGAPPPRDPRTKARDRLEYGILALFALFGALILLTPLGAYASRLFAALTNLVRSLFAALFS